MNLEVQHVQNVTVYAKNAYLIVQHAQSVIHCYLEILIRENVIVIVVIMMMEVCNANVFIYIEKLN